MSEFRATIGQDGRVVIPALYRKALHLHPGDELIMRLDNEELHLFSAAQSLKKAQALVRSHAKNKSLVTKLKAMRREDAKNE